MRASQVTVGGGFEAHTMHGFTDCVAVTADSGAYFAGLGGPSCLVDDHLYLQVPMGGQPAVATVGKTISCPGSPPCTVAYSWSGY